MKWLWWVLFIALLGCEKKESVLIWRGIGFGIEMEARLHGVQRGNEEVIFIEIEKAIQSLEKSFSLYSSQSELSRLNQKGQLGVASDVFLKLLDKAIVLQQRTQGYYNPTVHGLCNESGVLKWEAISKAPIRVQGREVQLVEEVELNFNAIVQGYLADEVRKKLQQLRVEKGALFLGETMVFGEVQLVGIKDGSGKVLDNWKVVNSGLAVSHCSNDISLINPVEKTIVDHDRVVAVMSPEGAAVADAFATAFAVAPKENFSFLCQELKKGKVKVWSRGELLFSWK